MKNPSFFFAGFAFVVALLAPNSVYLPMVGLRQGLAPTAPTADTSTPTPTFTSTPTETPTLTPTAIATPLVYICDHDAYNCADFDTQAAAQMVFDYCRDLGFGDVHKLDANNDGIACNALLPLGWWVLREK